MPLKHDTETVMVIVLALLIGLAGAVAAFLPPLTVSMWPWAVAFVIAIAYPLFLYPVLKERRADYEFRALHFMPALILLVWMALDLLATYRPQWQMLQSLYTWGWAIAIVAAAFVLLAIFCLRVIRQRLPRLGLLLAAFLLFVFLSQMSERFDWDRQLAMQWWNGSTGSGLVAGNLDSSTDPGEEQWRAQLRMMEKRRQELAGGSGISVTAVSAITGTRSSASLKSSKAASKGSKKSSSSKAVIAQNGSKSSQPPRLPSSGFGSEVLALGLLAGCCALIQRKTAQRNRMS
jgi:hypothetical protein